eukprot:scaffold401_cov399-Prasinococcus_capsulatus_cf.AAC.42
MQYYGGKRTQDGKGVTLPSQRRYVHYFHRLLASHPERPISLPTPPVCTLARVRLHGCPEWFRPVLRVHSHKAPLFIQRHGWLVMESATLELTPPRALCAVQGDFKVALKDGGGKCFAWQHTGMLSDDHQVVVVPGEEMDYFHKRWRRLPATFELELTLARAESGTSGNGPGDPPPHVESIVSDGTDQWATGSFTRDDAAACRRNSGQELQALTVAGAENGISR